MEQTFNDLLREREVAQRRLFGLVLWAFVETFVGVIRENMTSISMQKSIRRVALGTGLILLIPFFAMQVSDGWNWDLFDFVFMGSLLFGTGLAYELIAKKGGTAAYRAAVGITCAATFILIFINAAVGIIGDGPVNSLYLGVPAVLIAGAFIARFQPQGMALALFATALAQMLVPAIALVIWNAGWQELLIHRHSPHPPFHPGIAQVFALNAVFAIVFVGSALLFRQAAQKHN
jgi:hypothetical protein